MDKYTDVHGGTNAQNVSVYLGDELEAMSDDKFEGAEGNPNERGGANLFGSKRGSSARHSTPWRLTSSPSN